MDDEGVVSGTALGEEYTGDGFGVEGNGGETVDGFGRKSDGLEVVEMSGCELERSEGVLRGDAGTSVIIEGDGRWIAFQHMRRRHDAKRATETSQHI